ARRFMEGWAGKSKTMFFNNDHGFWEYAHKYKTK
ncbi:MAG: hypothetical protein FD188_3116, partial [Ignavibacteria bacterium]